MILYYWNASLVELIEIQHLYSLLCEGVVESEKNYYGFVDKEAMKEIVAMGKGGW